MMTVWRTARGRPETCAAHTTLVADGDTTECMSTHQCPRRRRRSHVTRHESIAQQELQVRERSPITRLVPHRARVEPTSDGPSEPIESGALTYRPAVTCYLSSLLAYISPQCWPHTMSADSHVRPERTCDVGDLRRSAFVNKTWRAMKAMAAWRLQKCP
jgi:hypothetical protein